MNSPDPISKERAKLAALEAAHALPGPDPVPSVTYRSAGKTLIVGAAADVAPWADALSALELTVLQTERVRNIALKGWLGAFEATWDGGQGRFDLVLDLSPAPLIARHEPPAGYFAPGPGMLARARAVEELAEMIGEFEKPKYFVYKERICAHSRNKQVGCNACIEICSAGAIFGAGDKIRVDPNLCAGCGACTTVCPTGALTYAYPSAAYTGERLRTLVGAYRDAGGGAPELLFHSGEHGRAVIGALEAGGQGVPAWVLPVELHHAASVGIDVWLAAVSYGAAAITVLMTDEEAPQYRSAVAAQMDIANTILDGLGYQGGHCRLVQVREAGQLGAALASPPSSSVVAEAATFHVMADKRNTLDLALSHLARYSPLKPAAIPLPAGAPFGNVRVDASACSLCMACVGACPSSALMDSTTLPQLRFVEKNCVQCGLCETTCPENAITLEPRISFAEDWNKPVVKHESTPFCCIRCAKPFGSLQMIENMLGKLGSHPAFAGNLDRIRMCGDCRVIDMMKSGDSARITGRSL